MRKLFTLFIAVMTTLGVAFGGVALADGPSGSTEEDNQVECGEDLTGGEAPLAVFAGETGAEACNDGDDLPVQGRVIASAEGYVAADGDDDNVFEGDDTLTGYARVDDGGLHCGNDANQDSTADQSENTAEDCGSEDSPLPEA